MLVFAAKRQEKSHSKSGF